MTNNINLQLYQGNGVPINEREIKLPEYETLFDENPKEYIAQHGLKHAVNVALTLGQPLLITGEPGTGKTRLAASVAYELGLHKPLEFHTKTTSTASDLFYEYDALGRFQDVQIPEKQGADIEQYISYKALGLAILLAGSSEKSDKFLPEELKAKSPVRSVVLIDEIDKAPRDLPNDILIEIERMEFTVKETKNRFKADPKYCPVLILTSNSEKNLPDAFLRRCVFFHISFPDKDQLIKILRKRFKDHKVFKDDFVADMVDHFNKIRDKRLKKPPATAEFLSWAGYLKACNFDNFKDLTDSQKDILCISYSILAKNKEDLEKLKENLKNQV